MLKVPPLVLYPLDVQVSLLVVVGVGVRSFKAPSPEKLSSKTVAAEADAAVTKPAAIRSDAVESDFFILLIV
jgi:hypothetical protein